MKNLIVLVNEKRINSYINGLLIWSYDKTLFNCVIFSEININKHTPIARFRLIPKEK